MLIAGANEWVNAITRVSISIDVATLLKVEFVESTQATNGTAGTDFASSLKQTRGFVAGDTTLPSGIGIRHTYTSEPTVLTVLDHFWINGPGPYKESFPLSRELQSLVSGATKYKAVGIRLTSTLASNALVMVEFEC
jgi:hypothetical protein